MFYEGRMVFWFDLIFLVVIGLLYDLILINDNGKLMI